MISTLAQESNPGLFDNELLDEFTIPFGEWIWQAVKWIDTELNPILKVIEWPFNKLIEDWVVKWLASASWVWVVLGMMLIAAIVQNVRVAVFVGAAISFCGLLGNAYWVETARTIGFVAVAVLFCVIIGIPLGVLAGRFDGVWQAMRPVLDAMQVVHSFVYMLPVIFFWGIGEVSATMVTMVFALPPLIRLTNLGVRQVPEDVVEASRAYGSSELRVLLDVQLPLARPAIMTGINQTLLLAISMLGIAAIMGAGGLGRLMFQALSGQDVARGASAGLAFFLVAVSLDRITQRDGTSSGSLMSRIHQAWLYRKEPEAMLAAGQDEPTDVEEREDGTTVVSGATPKPVVTIDLHQPISPRERVPMGIAVVGGLVALISTFLPWTANAGKFSAFGRRVDESLPGESFSGLDASGGSWFGVLVLIFGLLTVLSVVSVALRLGRSPRWLSSSSAVMYGTITAMVALAHLLGSTPAGVENPTTELGVIAALIGGVLATIGAAMWAWASPVEALRPLPPKAKPGLVVLAIFASLVTLGAMYAGWSFDGRTDVVTSPEVTQQIDELRTRAAAEPENAGAISAELSVLMAQARNTGEIVTDGLSSSGSRLGLVAFVVSLFGVATAIPAAGYLVGGQASRWFWAVITASIGLSVAAISAAWVLTHVRSADPNYLSGAGNLLAALGGFFMVAVGSGTLSRFNRARAFDDEPADNGQPDDQIVTKDSDSEKALAGAVTS